VDILREIYKFKIGQKKFTVYLHVFSGLVVKSQTMITTEVLHGQIYFLDDYIGKGRKYKGWCILRWHEEVSDVISEFTEQERMALSHELGWQIFDSWSVLSEGKSYGANVGFFTSNCLEEFLKWAKKHPIIFNRYYERSDDVRKLVSLIEDYKTK